MASIPNAPVQYELIRLQGGLDLMTPTLSLPPGYARDCVNWEVSINGGYTRIAGYERFDGRPNPSDATYGTLEVNYLAPIAVGDVIIGDISGASATVIAVTNSTVVYTKANLAFIVGDTLEVLGVGKAVVTALSGVVANNQTAAIYLNLAADEYRKDITEVPGEGPVRGVAYYNGNVYAWRNNVGSTALEMFKSSNAGWVQVPLGRELAFENGTNAIAEGFTVIGATSGASAVVARVVLESGDWTSSDAQGRLIFATVTGAFVNGEVLNIGITPCADTVGTDTAITLLPDGKIESVIANFGGGKILSRLYGCDRINRAFEFDGTTYVPLSTGMPIDAPDHIAFHKQHLFLSFGSSVQFSALGDPYSWSPLLGAGEIALQDDVTVFLVQPGDQNVGAMAIYTENTTSVLYGTSAADWNLVSYNIGMGAKAYSGQNMAQSFSFDDRGIVNLQAAQDYGNFNTTSMTLNIRPFIQQRRNLVTASNINREKAQYRVFFSDGYGLYLTIANNKMLGVMPVLFPDPVTCMVEGEKPDGSETTFFGSTNGFVYRLDAGTSFDGEQISANLVLVFNAIKSPRVRKRYRRASLEITGTGYAEFTFSYDLGYSSPTINTDPDRIYESELVASFWDQVFWDNFVWDGRTLAPSEIELRGTAENIAVRIASISDFYPSFTVNSVILHYTPRRGLR